MREFRRRYALAPHAPPSRRELIEESAYAAAEADGFFAPERLDVALAAIYYLLGLLARARGLDLDAVARSLGDWDAIRARAYVAPSPEAQAALEDDQTRRAFAPFLQRALRAANAAMLGKERHEVREEV